MATADRDPAPAASGTITADLVVNPAPFFATQASCLRSGLASPDDAATVGAVAEIHSRSHERWLATIRLVAEEHGLPAGDAVAALYAFHGRLVESLQRRQLTWLPPAVATQARAVMAYELDDLTAAAINAVSARTAQP